MYRMHVICKDTILNSVFFFSGFIKIWIGNKLLLPYE